MPDGSEHYDVIFGNFMAQAPREVRREVYGEDFGQNSWVTAEEFATFTKWLALDPSTKVLDVGCGSGGPALRLARTVGCGVTGLDINAGGLLTARHLAASQGHPSLALVRADAGSPLPFGAGTFDGILCIDSMNHLRDRALVLREWARVLVAGGRALYTDGTIVTGRLSSEELAVRSAIGYLEFSPPGENERLISEAGLRLVLREDLTAAIARLARRRVEARERHGGELLGIEGVEGYGREQRFYAMVHRLAAEGRLARFAFLAAKPGIRDR